VGLPLAVAFAQAGFQVRGLDADPERVVALAGGRSHSPDVAATDLAPLLRSGRYVPTSDPAVLHSSDVIIICVPTPLRKSKDPDISFVIKAAETVAARLKTGHLVVLESTTYPGTTEELVQPMFEARGARIGHDVFLAFSPERIDPGNGRYSVRDIPKVVGGVTPACTRLTATLYRHIVPAVVETSSPKVAELAKLYENVFRNVNIALANELALICHKVGVPTREVIEAAASKPFGFMPFYPGPGIGGHCIGIDPIYLAWKLRAGGYEARFIHLADEINRAMPAHTVAMVTDALNDRGRCLNGARILALGVAYKRGVGDTRESPALEVLARLRAAQAEVAYADPHVASIVLDGITLKAVEETDEELARADCVVILTDHPQFDYRRVLDQARLVVDTRNATWGLTAPGDRLVRL
jgi:UDP-N-acetyl-D-glucosamine dehydrogenase